MAELEKYFVTADGVKADVHIERTNDGTFYTINTPGISDANKALMSELKHSLITEVMIGSAEILDPKLAEDFKKKFFDQANVLLDKIVPGIGRDTKNILVGMLMHDMLGLGDIEFLLNDVDLEEIVINSSQEPVRIFHKKYGWLQTNVTIESEAKILNYANIIARRVGRQITTLNPLLDAHLLTGDRSNAVLYPVSHKGHTITIRKFARDPWTVTDFITNSTCTARVFALIWLAIQYELNILVSGGTGSGKTSLLNVILPFIPPNHRIISIEDTLELQLPKFLYWAPLTVRQPNPEGKGGVDMLDLLVNSLRMRPDRIILGEIRKAAQAEVLFEAMHTGHSVYATVHADSMSETIRRLINPPINVPSNLLTAVNLNVVMFRDRRRGIRRVYQVGEYTAGEEGKEIMSNLLYRWSAVDDKIIKHAEPVRLFEDLSTHTGLSQDELMKNLEEKERILNWMVKNKIRKMEEVGEVIHKYYTDPASVFKK